MSASVMVAECSVCGQVKEGPVPESRPGQPPQPFICSDCLKKQKQPA